MFSKVIFLILIIQASSSSKTENCTISTPLQIQFPTEIICQKNETYTVIEADSNLTGAKCLDGSSYKFLIHKGSGSGSNKFLFYFEGAAYCGADGQETLLECYDRSLTLLGSSNRFGANGTEYQMNFSAGYASMNKQANPKFYNWNIMFVVYCDGTSSQGYLKEPIMYNGTIPLWFRGFNNTLAVFEYGRKNMGLFEAEEVLLTGGSSGGTTAMFWAPYLQDYFPKSLKVFGLSDGGMFLDEYDSATGCHLFKYQMQNLAYLTNANTSELYRRCKYSYSIDEVWRCMVPQYIYDTIDYPFFLANSQEDTQQLTSFYGIYCLIYGGPQNCTEKELNKITWFREKMMAVILKIKQDKPSWGFWIRDCFEHTYQFTWAWYGTTMQVFNADLGISLNLQDSFIYWYNDGEIKKHNHNSFIDLLDWKHNTYCIIAK